MHVYKINIFFDAACFDLQGSFWGCVSKAVHVEVDGETQEQWCSYAPIGSTTNNHGEWAACLEAFITAHRINRAVRKEKNGAVIKIFGDSQIVINAINKGYCGEQFKPVMSKIMHIHHRLQPAAVIWIPRRFNTKADALSKLGLTKTKNI